MNYCRAVSVVLECVRCPGDISESKLLILALRESDGYFVGVAIELSGGMFDIDE
jgi:hypothetical protein